MLDFLCAQVAEGTGKPSEVSKATNSVHEASTLLTQLPPISPTSITLAIKLQHMNLRGIFSEQVTPTYDQIREAEV